MFSGDVIVAGVYYYQGKIHNYTILSVEHFHFYFSNCPLKLFPKPTSIVSKYEILAIIVTTCIPVLDIVKPSIFYDYYSA